MPKSLWPLGLAAALFTFATAGVAADAPQLMESRVFAVFGSGEEPQWIKDTRERLNDPARRPALRQERKAQLQETYVELGAALGLDAETEAKLLELLTDHTMEQLDEVHGRTPREYSRIEDLAEDENRKLDQLRDLLGAQGLARYQRYTATLAERSQVVLFDARLGQADKLQPQQKQRLMALLREKSRNDLQAARSGAQRPALQLLSPESMTPEVLQRANELGTIAVNEETLRRMLAGASQLSLSAAQFLTPVQLAAFDRMNREQASGLLSWLEQARARAGLDPAIPARAEAPSDATPQRNLVTGDVKFEITLTVDGRQPVSATHVGANGEPVTIQTPAGLMVEITPNLYDDDWLDVSLAYYETDGQRKRRLDSSSSFGTATRLPDGTTQFGMAEMLAVGARAYAVRAQVAATAAM